MREDVRLRVEQAAALMLNSGATVRTCAARLGVSKTTIHKDMRLRLPRLDEKLYARVDAVLRKNLEERHLRGGDATRRKYLELREDTENRALH